MRNEVLRGQVSRTSRAAIAIAVTGWSAACGAAPIAVAPLAEVSPETAADASQPAGAPRSEKKPEPLPPPIVWETSERDARERAKRTSAPLLVYLRADWSAESLREERELWSDPRVVRGARGFVALRIDLTSTAGDADPYLARYEITVVPTTIVFDATGRRASALSGETDVARLLNALASID